MAIDVAAGARITSTMLNAFVPKYIVKGSNQTNLTITSANDAAFAAIPFAAGQTWECKLLLAADGPTGADIKLNWVITGGIAAFTRWCYGPSVSVAGANDTPASMQNRDGTVVVSYGVGNSATIRAGIMEQFTIVTAALGTLTLQWAQAAGPSGTLTVFAGSYFVAHRVA